MSTESDTAAGLGSGTSLPWFRVWVAALTRPSVATYQRLLEDPKATSARAYWWVFLCVLISAALQLVLSLLGRALIKLGFGSLLLESTTGLSFLIPLWYGLVRGATALPYMALWVGLSHLIARALRGTGTYSRLVYAFAAFLAPLTLLRSLLILVPYGIYLQNLVPAYGIVLSVIAVRAVNEFGWGKAIASAVVPPVGMVVAVACVIVFPLWYRHRMADGIFEDIVEQITTPSSP